MLTQQRSPILRVSRTAEVNPHLRGLALALLTASGVGVALAATAG